MPIKQFTTEELAALTFKDIHEHIAECKQELLDQSRDENIDIRRRHESELKALAKQWSNAFEDFQHATVDLIKSWQAAQDE